ncbi:MULTISPECIES: TM2 domain-containing protein [Vibrio]|nr:MULTISPECIES: TM2 domain-containing protein [Vibrio]NAW70151.1 NINE protein [Vibrio sp. V28_P6S34P95]NAX05382.1 NINE protein [Vibrio sp. V30_P3S12P165]NNN45455.1 TM2 domain-containing protein [Vibrio sp. 1-1(7)]NNN73261.1 TM2 domain-containing protein [Vibrio sp. 12-2(3-a)]
MKGTIIDFNESQRLGLISGEDGQRYQLAMSEWKGSQFPKVGAAVDFSVEGDQSISVYPLSVSSGSSKKIAAALLAFFFGAFGVHKFYLGYKKQGWIMLLGFIFGFILLGIPSMIIGIIAFVEFIIYLTKSDEDFENIYVNGSKPWF